MNIVKIEAEGRTIAIVNSSEVVIEDVQSALDLIATVNYETGSDRMVIHKSLLTKSFFDLKTRLSCR